MAVTQTTILASGTTEATSTTVAVDAGMVQSVGIFGAAGAVLPAGVAFAVQRVTPGSPNPVAYLTNGSRDTQLSGPATYVVKRPPLTGDAFGVFKDV